MLTNASFTTSHSPPVMGEMETGHWNKVVRLLLLSTLSAVGTVGNIFAISAIMLENSLKRRGNIFIVNLAIADFIVSAFAIPASSITILAGIQNNDTVCKFQWFAAILCCHVSVLSLMFISVENFSRICRYDTYDIWFSKMNIIAMVIFIWTVTTTCVSLQFGLSLGPRYCQKEFKGTLSYHATVGILLVCLPTVIAFACYLRAIFEGSDNPKIDGSASVTMTATGGGSMMASMSSLTSPQGEIKLTSPSMASTLAKDYALLKTNFLVFVVFLSFWLPLGIAMSVGSVHTINDKVYDNLSWLALSNSCVNSFIYGLSNKPFRNAYNNLFHYCCCKTSVSFGARRPRSDASSRTHSDVRVHIIPGYNMHAPPRRCCDLKEKRNVSSKPKTTKAKDVYNL